MEKSWSYPCLPCWAVCDPEVWETRFPFCIANTRCLLIVTFIPPVMQIMSPSFSVGIFLKIWMMETAPRTVGWGNCAMVFYKWKIISISLQLFFFKMPVFLGLSGCNISKCLWSQPFASGRDCSRLFTIQYLLGQRFHNLSLTLRKFL